MTGSFAVGAVLVGPDRFHSGGLELRDGRVSALTGPPAAPTNRFAIPGLRNAHVHLDLSHVSGMPRASSGFAAWVLELIRRRGPFVPATFQRAATAGALECLATGTTAVADIDSSGAASAAVAATGLKGAACREVLGGLPPSEAERWLDGFDAFAPGAGLRPGLSPHAPYSTTPAQYVETRRLADRSGAPWTTHLAETTAEVDLLRDGTGELREMLDRLGAPLPFESPPGVSPVSYLAGLGCLSDGALLAHVNHVDDDGVRAIADAGAVVVYCPRSHDFFGHPAHPLTRLRARGVRVALGTDSRASNASLSMFAEMAFLRAARPDLSPASILSMATEVAAPWLDGGGGRLEPGSPADLVVVEAPGGRPSTLAEALDVVTLGTLRIVATVVSGVICYEAPIRPSGSPALTPPEGGLLSSDSQRPL